MPSHLEDGSSNPSLIAAPNHIIAVDDHMLPLASQSTISDKCQRIISPIPTRHDSITSHCTAKNDDFPLHLICPFQFEPPISGVTFDIPDSNGIISPQCLSMMTFTASLGLQQ